MTIFEAPGQFPDIFVDIFRTFFFRRAKAVEIKKLLSQWFEELGNNKRMTINAFSTNLKIYETHSEAIYTSRFLNLSNLPKPGSNTYIF